MGFKTKPILSDRQVKQPTGSVLTLSGSTDFVGTLKSKGIEINASADNAQPGYILTYDGTKIALSESTGAGIGLSVDSNDNIKLGDDTTVFYVDTPNIKNFFISQTRTGLGSFLYSGYGAVNSNLAESGFATTNGGNLGSEISSSYNSLTSKATAKFQINSSAGFTLLTIDEDNGFRLRDDIKQTGLVYHTNYFTNGNLNDRWVPDWGAVKQYTTNVLQLENGIIVRGTTVQSGNDITLNTTWIWRINNIEYQLSSNTTLTFPPAATGNQRIDLIVGNTSGGIQRIIGTEVDLESPLVAPTAPANTISLVEVFILETGIESFTQFALSTFVRYDVNNQNLSEIQRQNARTNIQALSRDTNDLKFGNISFRDSAGLQNAVMQQTSQGSETLFEFRLLNQAGVRTMRLLNGVPQTGLGSTSPQFHLRGSGTATRTMVTWSDGNNNPLFSMLASGVSQFFNSAPIIPRSTSIDRSVRRDELYLNYQENIETSSQINDLVIGEGTKLIRFTTATELTGIVASTTTNGRLIRIYNDRPGGDLVIKDNFISSSAANRFDIGGDINIPYKKYKTFVYVDGRWREEDYLRDFEPLLVSVLSPLKFDFDYQIGSSLTPVSGNITFDLTDVIIGSNSNVFHQNSIAPTFGNNIKLVLIGFTLADYQVDELNEFQFYYFEDPQNSNEPYLKVYHNKNITVIN
jgi:hypothetical protein